MLYVQQICYNLFMRQKNIRNYTWIDIEEPDSKDIEFLRNKYKFHHLALEDCLSSIQRPKIDTYNEYLFLVFHLPRHHKIRHRTLPQEVDIFIGKNFIITLHQKGIKPIDQIFQQVDGGSNDLRTENPSMLLYEILDRSFDFCFPMLDKISDKLDYLEDELYHDGSRENLEKIAILERDIINFRRIINPQRHIVRDIESMKSSYLDKEIDIYFGDIADKIERIWDLLNNYKEVSEVLQHTSESILTHKLNEIIKILTIISVIMLPLTVITGFYGMNVVGLPLANHKLASEFIIGILTVVILVMLLYFNRKKWL